MPNNSSLASGATLNAVPDGDIQQSAAAPRAGKRNQRTPARLAGLLGWVLAAVLLMSFMFSQEGISELQRSRRRVAELEASIKRLEQENQQLESEIRSLKESTFALERIAREDLGMAREGEIVYMLPKDEE